MIDPHGPANADLARRRLELDLEDLRFENARLRASVAERQAEIAALSERLGKLQAQVEGRRHVRLRKLAANRLSSLGLLLRRR